VNGGTSIRRELLDQTSFYTATDLDNELRRGTAALSDGRVDSRNGDLGIPTRTQDRNRIASVDNERRVNTKRDLKPAADGKGKTKKSIDQIDVNKSPRKTYSMGSSDNRIKSNVPSRLKSKRPVYKTKRPAGYNRSRSNDYGKSKSYGNNSRKSHSVKNSGSIMSFRKSLLMLFDFFTGSCILPMIDATFRLPEIYKCSRIVSQLQKIYDKLLKTSNLWLGPDIFL